MKRSLWGEFESDGDNEGLVKSEDIVLPSAKHEKLSKIRTARQEAGAKIKTIQLKNPLLTQTVEVMNQTEMLQALIDTYANKRGCNNYLVNPCQVIPQVDFPPENSTNLIQNEIFSKPLWFIPPIDTNFSKGSPTVNQPITGDIAKIALRKAIAGLSRVIGFNEATNSALILLTDCVEEYIHNLLKSMKRSKDFKPKEKANILDIESIENGYMAVAHDTLLSLHNYYKTNVIRRNAQEINEFEGIYNEYDELRKESQNAQKFEFKEEENSDLSNM